MILTRLFVLVLLVFVVLAAIPAQAGVPLYSLTPLDLSIIAVDINDSGQVAANSSSAGRVLLWQDGVIQDLGGGYSNKAYGMNNSGQIVGRTENAQGVYHASLWHDSVMEDLPTLGGSQSLAYGMNGLGQVVGSADTAQGWSHAFLWQNGVIRDIGTSGSNSYASAINDSSQVVGVFNGRGSLWQNGATQDLGTLGGYATTPSAINDSGQVVGGSRVSQGYEHAFLWQDGGIQDLGTLDADESTAYDINNSGQVVGRLSSGLSFRAFLWQTDTGILDLRACLDASGAGWTLEEARAINSSGWIVGSGINPATGYHQSFLLKPVPEPSGIFTLLGGLASLGILRRRKA